ncbi:alpha/beta hydrolase [Legionella spiritensis]|uniref:alpha/beta hydrolase n=1 Tax=Legionella spiritensis TaxID=452 RepID=UPI000F70485B|nr:alpha/beta hydrolase [Legionella spiritensis]VEG89627.1 alpha/beta hydrolase [Legionella spiritensis]
MTHHLNTDSQAFLKRLTERATTALNGNNLLELPPDKARDAFNLLIAPVPGKLKPVSVHIEDRKIETEGTTTGVRLYKPTQNSKDLPVLVYCHGGGFVFGDPDFLDYTCRTLCEGAHCIVATVDYRRAPEHKFPAAHDDCYRIVRYAQKHAKELGGNGKVAVGGDSAGGNIAASICHQARSNKDVSISFQLLYYPWVDLNNTTVSDKTFATGYFLETETLHWMRRQYLSGPDDEKSPIANPQFQKDFSNLPPALVIAAECDPIHDDAKMYYQKLIEGGNRAQFIEFGGILHDFCALPSHYDAALLAFSASVHALKKAFND